MSAAAERSRKQMIAKERLIRAVLHRVAGERDDPHANFDAELEYNDEMIMTCAAELCRADHLRELVLELWKHPDRSGLSDNTMQSCIALMTGKW